MKKLLRKIFNIPGRTARGILALGRICTSYKSCVLILLAVVAIELCILGAGVVRRLENSYHLAMEAARTELALLEAQELAETLPNKGSAGIGATENSQAPAATGLQEAPDTATDTPPPLRPRDVATIVAQETGEPLQNDTTPTDDTEQQEQQAPPNETRVQSGDNLLQLCFCH